MNARPPLPHEHKRIERIQPSRRSTPSSSATHSSTKNGSAMEWAMIRARVVLPEPDVPDSHTARPPAPWSMMRRTTATALSWPTTSERTDGRYFSNSLLLLFIVRPSNFRVSQGPGFTERRPKLCAHLHMGRGKPRTPLSRRAEGGSNFTSRHGCREPMPSLQRRTMPAGFGCHPQAQMDPLCPNGLP